jgi:histidine kinase
MNDAADNEVANLDNALENDSIDPRSDIPILWFEECFAAARAHRGALHGRAEEVDLIHQVYERAIRNASTKNASQLVLISGVTGIGKTALARSLRRQVEDVDGGYFVCGKFDQLQRPEPHSAFVEAITQLLSRIQDRGEVSDFRDALAKQGIDYEHGGRDLIEIVPALDEMLSLPNREKSISKVEYTNSSQSLIAEHVTSGLSTNRWKDLFRLFLRAASTLEKPFIVLIEDIHWIDECSLDVLHALVDDQKTSGALFVCTFRMSEELNVMALDRILQDLKQNDVQITQIHLEGLTQTAVTSLVSSALSANDDHAAPLAWTIYDWTKGNAFLTWKSLHSLYFKKLISVDHTKNQFSWDMEEILVETDSVSNLIRYKVEKLPPTLQEYLKIAACLGSKLDEDILKRLLTAEPNLSSTFLHDVAKTWLIYFDESRGAWCFGHDCVQEATYQLIPVNERSAYHYRIGRKLWREFDLDELSQFLFLVVNQLLLGIE